MSRHAMGSADAAWLHMDRPTNLMVVNGFSGSTRLSTGHAVLLSLTDETKEDGSQALAKVLIARPDAQTVLRGELGVAERVAWSPAIPLDDVKALGHATGSTVNDVLVAALAGALRD